MEHFFEGMAPKYINPNLKTVTNKDLTIPFEINYQSLQGMIPFRYVVGMS